MVRFGYDLDIELDADAVIGSTRATLEGSADSNPTQLYLALPLTLLNPT